MAPRSGSYSPLRYPGGKGKLARFVADLIRRNELSDGLYVEPYAGGAAVAWELLLTGVVRRVAINDISQPVHAFWDSVLNRTDDLIKLINDTAISLEERDRQKAIFDRPLEHAPLDLGFAMFFLNRVHRSGILNGGVIGGRAQTGQWKINARFNKPDLVSRIEQIADARRRIELTNLDAVALLEAGSSKWDSKTLVYLDPPYYEKGSQLYHHYYRHPDHARVSEAVKSLTTARWIVSYDDVQPIHDLYTETEWLQYSIGYSARERGRGREAMFFSDGIIVPEVTGSMIEIARCDGDLALRPAA
ncbi:DNA adenine methylase [Brevundimonas diminuta]|uniref:DNA adenine methylase n=1 Tax=Brevundimonas diminuta TaxID=293 RepID=UPI0019076FE9|nr:DNA adenine methylase [Brevundimonas diminuta]MBK1974777.1 DNA adenine methylase [Brevundimonas diminuta]